MEAPMEVALSGDSSPFRRNEFLTYLLETRVPGVHFHVGSDGLPDATMSAHCCEHASSGYRQNLQGWSSDKPAICTKVQIDDLKGASSTAEEENLGDPAPAVPVVTRLSHSQCLQFLVGNGPNFLMKNLDHKVRICSLILAMADSVQVLPPGNAPLPWDVLDMAQWKACLTELINEMKIVEENCCASLMRSSGAVYVLTTSPYPAFLRALAMEITDRASPCR